MSLTVRDRVTYQNFQNHDHNFYQIGYEICIMHQTTISEYLTKAAMMPETKLCAASTRDYLKQFFLFFRPSDSWLLCGALTE